MNTLLLIITANIFSLSYLMVISTVLIVLLYKLPKIEFLVRRYLIVACILIVLSICMAIGNQVGFSLAEEKIVYAGRLSGIAIISSALNFTGVVFAFFSALLAANLKSRKEDQSQYEWSWFAFLFCPIWSIVNGVYIGLLSIIPGAGMVVAVYMAIFGKKIINDRIFEKRKANKTNHFLP